MRPLGWALLACLAAGAPLSAQTAADRWATYEALEIRSIGPAGMSGRVASVDVAPDSPGAIFVGASTGGVWRSIDGGLTWEPVFDEQPLQGVGAVAVSPADPSRVWVGTGEGNPRNSAGVGAGIYRSRDGGESWELVGLERSERIARIVAHPTDPDVAWVAAMGPAWSDGEERGVYRTTDGGDSWERVLHVDERTGAADLVIDPSNPDRLLAAMWEFRRWPWFFVSGGPGSGLFASADGGDTWGELGAAEGLPEGELGRIGLAFSRSDPRVVYALVEAGRSALIRSDDGGRSWRTVNDDQGVARRPFYYADIRVDPEDPDRVYNLHSTLQVSEDGGRTFRTVVPSFLVHGDIQELWIDPHDADHMIVGNDGGIAVSYDRGRSWRFVENLPVAQFYHISVDDAVPFNVYGGMQDNGSWWGPSDVWENRGIMNAHWRRVGGGDGFHVANDPSDPDYGYSMSQQGNLMRFDKRTGERRDIQPVAPDGDTLRFNWNAGFAIDPFDPATIYLGSQYLHRSRDNGRSWEIISPDLTTDDPEKQRQEESGGITIDATGAENHTTIVSVAPSPLEPGTIWVGTDDGNVQLTLDGGGSWTEVGRNLPGVPHATWVPHVEPSRHDPRTAYVVLDDHRRGNWTPYVFRTTDRGRSWTSLVTPELDGFYHVLEEDPVDPDLLFLGGEFGLWVSRDRGASWFRWEGLPAAPVRDLVVHPRDQALVVATHGRGAWVLDDVGPLRPRHAPRTSAHLYPPAPVRQHERAEAIGYRSVGHAMYFGEMRPYGALLHFAVPGGEEGRALLRIRGPGGEVVRSSELAVRPGVNRFRWDLEDSLGVPVLPGRYRVELEAAGGRAAEEVEVVADPRSRVTPTARIARRGALLELVSWRELAGEADRRLTEATRELREVVTELRGEHEALHREGMALAGELEALRARLFEGRDALDREVRAPFGMLSSSWEEPSPNERRAMERGRRALETIVDEVNRAFRDDLEPYRERLRRAGHPPPPAPEALRLPTRDGVR